jgi:hypothetical protein
MSSCTLFKALGLVNTCGDESPTIPEPPPIDAGIRIRAAQEEYDLALKKFSIAHEKHDNAVSEDKKTRQAGSKKDTRLMAADRIIKYGKEATGVAVKVAIAKSILLPYESTSSPLVSPNGKYFGYVNSNGKFTISTTNPIKTYGVIGVSRQRDFWYINNANVPSNRQGTSLGGIQLTNDGTILTNLYSVDWKAPG